MDRGCICRSTRIGRTGLCGLGLLARWGPNHAADLLLTCDHPVKRVDSAKANKEHRQKRQEPPQSGLTRKSHSRAIRFTLRISRPAYFGCIAYFRTVPMHSHPLRALAHCVLCIAYSVIHTWRVPVYFEGGCVHNHTVRQTVRRTVHNLVDSPLSTGLSTVDSNFSERFLLSGWTVAGKWLELELLCAQRVRWCLLVMRGVSLVGVSQSEVGYNSNSST